MYGESKGVPKDYALAYKWYNLAAAKEHTIQDLRTMDNVKPSTSRDDLALRMNTSQIQERVTHETH